MHRCAEIFMAHALFSRYRDSRHMCRVRYKSRSIPKWKGNPCCNLVCLLDKGLFLWSHAVVIVLRQLLWIGSHSDSVQESDQHIFAKIGRWFRKHSRIFCLLRWTRRQLESYLGVVSGRSTDSVWYYTRNQKLASPSICDRTDSLIKSNIWL